MNELSLREIQQGSFEVLKIIKKICDDNGFNYYLMYGTLLGAVRHHGFIPWDDDIDIMMPRNDYEKFIEYCINNKEELKPLELLHYKTNKKYIYPIARLSDPRYKIDYNNTKDYGLGLFVDIYPFDGIDDNDKKYTLKMYKKARNIIIAGKLKCEKSNSFIKSIGKYMMFQLLKMIDINKKIRDIDIYSQKYKYESSQKVNCVCWDINISKSIDKNMIEGNKKELEFNGIKFRVPSDYDGVLKLLYNDYMKLPPENERVGHHFYKAYRKEELKEDKKS